MAYNKAFWINVPKWNNAFWAEKRIWRKIYVPSIRDGNFVDLEIWDEVVFEELNEDWTIKSCKWLKNFIHTSWKWKEVFIFDNHNHTFFFWCEAISKWIVKASSLLIHIDEHKDTRMPEKMIWNDEISDLNRVFDYTNYELNVWNYIEPAKNAWIIWDIIMIQGEDALLSALNKIRSKKQDKWIILNLDLDFFSDWMSYFSETEKIKKIREIGLESDLITIATSPYFIDQNKAIEICRKIFI